MDHDELDNEVEQGPAEADMKVEEAIETYGFDRDDPGSTILWFGKHKDEGLRFDAIDEGYRWFLLARYTELPQSPNVSCNASFARMFPHDVLSVQEVPRSTRCIQRIAR